jgi:excisionase family DNA binding protein
MAAKTNSRQRQHRPTRAKPRPQPPARVRDVYTALEVAERLGIHRAAVYAGARAGRIPSLRVSAKRVIFPKSAFDSWLKEARSRAAVA